MHFRFSSPCICVKYLRGIKIYDIEVTNYTYIYYGKYYNNFSLKKTIYENL